MGLELWLTTAIERASAHSPQFLSKLIIVKGKLRVAGVKLRLAGKRHRGILLSVQSSEFLEFRVFIDYVTNCENLPSQESIVHQTYDPKKCECFKFNAITNGTQ